MFRQVTVFDKGNDDQLINVFFNEDVFAHIQPPLSREHEETLLRIIAGMMAEMNGGKKVEHPVFVQHAFFKDTKQNNLHIIFENRNKTASYGEDSKQPRLSSSKPFFAGFDNEHSSLQKFNISKPKEYSHAIPAFENNQQEAFVILKGESLPPIAMGDEYGLLKPQNQSDLESNIEVARYIYQKFTGDNKVANQKKFANILLNPGSVIAPYIVEVEERQFKPSEQFYAALRQQQSSKSQDEDVSEYQEEVVRKKVAELKETQQFIISQLQNFSIQILSNEDRLSLQEDLKNFTKMRDKTDKILARIITAIYMAAKNYYVSLFKSDSKLQIQQEIQKFNALFAAFHIQIDERNLSLSGLEHAFRNMRQHNFSALAGKIEKLLNESYDKHKKQDAFSFISDELNKLNHAGFTVKQQKQGLFTDRQSAQIERLGFGRNHSFSFHPVIENTFGEFNKLYQAITGEEARSKVEQVYTTGTRLESMAEGIACQGEKEDSFVIEDLERIKRNQEIAAENIKLQEQLNKHYKRLSEVTNSIDDGLVVQHELLEGAVEDAFTIPARGDQVSASIPEEGNAREQFHSLLQEVARTRTGLLDAVQKLKKERKDQVNNLDAIMEKANESATDSSLRISEMEVQITDLSGLPTGKLRLVDAIKHTEALINDIDKRTQEAKRVVANEAKARKQQVETLAYVEKLAKARAQLREESELQPVRIDKNQITDIDDLADGISRELDGRLARLGPEANAIKVFNDANQQQALETAHAVLDNGRPNLDEHVRLETQQLNTAIAAQREAIIQQKKDAYDILQAHLLAQAIFNFEYWHDNTPVPLRGLLTEITYQNQQYNVPSEILTLVNDLKGGDAWLNQANHARAFIDRAKLSAQDRSSNPAVRDFFAKVSALQTTDQIDNFDFNNIYNVAGQINNATLNHQGNDLTLVGRPAINLQKYNSLKNIGVNHTTGYQRLKARYNNWKTNHPIAHKVLWGSIIGLGIAAAATAIVFSGGLAAIGIGVTAGTIVGAFGGGAVGAGIAAAVTVGAAATITAIGAGIGALVGKIKQAWSNRRARRQGYQVVPAQVDDHAHDGNDPFDPNRRDRDRAMRRQPSSHSGDNVRIARGLAEQQREDTNPFASTRFPEEKVGSTNPFASDEEEEESALYFGGQSGGSKSPRRTGRDLFTSNDLMSNISPSSSPKGSPRNVQKNKARPLPPKHSPKEVDQAREERDERTSPLKAFTDYAYSWTSAGREEARLKALEQENLAREQAKLEQRKQELESNARLFSKVDVRQNASWDGYAARKALADAGHKGVMQADDRAVFETAILEVSRPSHIKAEQWAGNREETIQALFREPHRVLHGTRSAVIEVMAKPEFENFNYGKLKESPVWHTLNMLIRENERERRQLK